MRNKSLIIILAIAIPVGLGITAVFAVLLWLALSIPVQHHLSEQVEGERWTLDELVDHLRKDGLELEVYPYKAADGNPAVWLVNRNALRMHDEQKDEFIKRIIDEPWSPTSLSDGIALVKRYPSAGEAQKAESYMATWSGSWGRFLIISDVAHAFNRTMDRGSIWEFLHRRY